MEWKAAVIVALVSTVPSAALGGIDFFVAPNGNDTNPGTRSKPFRTLVRARDAVRQARATGGIPAGGVTVWLREGTYPVLSTFELGAEDGGTEDAPVVYRACPGETVRLVGGKEITGFRRVADPAVLGRMEPSCRGRVLECDLKAQGITDFGRLTNRGFGRPNRPSHLELFFNDRPMTLACWPNAGWAEIADVPAGPNGGKFTYAGDRPSRWTHADDIWVHGYWTWPWADSYEKVKSIDTNANEIYTEPPHGVYGYQAHKRWRALNLLEELDEPGEYYLDRRTGILYFWPPEPVSGRAHAVVSIIENPIIAIRGAKHIRLQGLIFEACRGCAVEITNCEHVVLAGCVIRNVGTCGVGISGGRCSGLLSCDVYETGDSGVELGGGDRKTLAPARNFVENCRIHNFSRWDRTYKPGIIISGVGNRIAHNLMYSAPHSAIILHGNDHVIEFNEIHHVCNETGDAGAFYMGRDWSQRGNVVRFNYFHDLGSYEDRFSAHHFSETMAVYLDDFTCGTRVYGNVFYRANRAVLIGGGRDNTVENNIFVDCKPAIHVDARGLADWTKEYWDGTYPILFDRLKDVNATQPPYTERYPELATLLEDEPRVPKNNRIVRNIVVGEGNWLAAGGVKPEWMGLGDNFTESDPMFVDPAKPDFRLKPESPALKLGFKQIPFDRIGPYEDEYRRGLDSGRGTP